VGCGEEVGIPEMAVAIRESTVASMSAEEQPIANRSAAARNARDHTPTVERHSWLRGSLCITWKTKCESLVR